MKNAAYMISVLALLVVSGRVIYDLRAGNTHPGDVGCESCHLAREAIDESNAQMLIDSQEVLCKDCHENALTASHPSGFEPAYALPEIFPLDWKAELTCSTCHAVHSSTRGLMVTHLTGKELCHSCHDQEFFDNMKDMGSSIFASGHGATEDIDFGAEMDPFSARCMECHAEAEGALNIEYSSGGIIRHSRVA